MTNEINIILFDEEETTQILIENYLKELTFSYNFKKYNETNFSVLQRNALQIVIVNVSASNLSILNEIRKYSTNKNILFIVISYNKTADINVNAIRSGAKEFLVKPLIKNDFLNTLQKLKNILTIERKNKTNCHTSLVMSVEKGTGKTFFALNVAKEVADISKEKVLLIDFNNNLNDLGSRLNMDFVYNTPYIINEIVKDNVDVLNKIHKYPNSTLHIMANGMFCNNVVYTTQVLEEFFNKIKKHFRYIFIDIDPGLQTNKSIVEASDTIYAILEPSMDMFSSAIRLDLKYYRGKNVRYILNKFNENKESELVAKLEDIISKQVFIKIPLNYMATNSACSTGKTLKEISPKLDVVEKYLRLAKYIATRE